MSRTRFSLITTCRGRLHHVRETLPLMAAQPDVEVILVDDACPDGTGNWVEANFPGVKVVRSHSENAFNLARARNIGVGAASAEWLLFVDADVRIEPGWIDWMRVNVEPGRFYWIEADPQGRRNRDLFGTLICHRSDFAALEGYDEVFQGWGGEDSDLKERLVINGVKEDFFPARFISAIPHSDRERAGWSGMADRAQKHLLIQCYKLAKAQVARLQAQGTPLSLDIRQSLWDFTAGSISQWCNSDMSQPLKIHYRLVDGVGRPVSQPYALRAALVLEVAITHAEAAQLANS